MSEEYFYVQALPPRHIKGDGLCPGCERQGRSVTPCECGGLIHEDYTGENKTSVFTIQRCDKCGGNYKVIYGEKRWAFERKKERERKARAKKATEAELNKVIGDGI